MLIVREKIKQTIVKKTNEIELLLIESVEWEIRRIEIYHYCDSKIPVSFDMYLIQVDNAERQYYCLFPLSTLEFNREFLSLLYIYSILLLTSVAHFCFAFWSLYF